MAKKTDPIVAAQAAQDEIDLALMRHVKTAMEDGLAGTKEWHEQAQDATKARSQTVVENAITQAAQSMSFAIQILDSAIVRLAPPAPVLPLVPLPSGQVIVSAERLLELEDIERRAKADDVDVPDASE
jgi:hypothetical protein